MKQRKKEDDVLEKSCYIKGKVIAEQCYDGKKVFFAVWDGVDVSYRPSIDDGIQIKPIWAEEVQKKAIALPEKAQEYGTDEELDKEIIKFIDKWLDISDDFKQFCLWNIKRSWVYDRFHTLNYLRALGDTGMGKSRFLDVLGILHYKPIFTSGAATASPVFRLIEKWKGTLIMDEADFEKSDENQDIIKIINMGYERGKHVIRSDKDNLDAVNFFDPYCPKILATRKVFDDKAVESRCITEVMRGTYRDNIPVNLNDSFFKDAQILRNKLLLWRFKHYWAVEPNKEIDIGVPGLEPRIRQIVSGFVNLFADDEKLMDRFRVFIKKHQESIISERQSSWYGEIVGALHELVKNGQQDISMQDIIDQGQLTNYKGQPLKPRGLVSTIKALGFGSSYVQRIGETTKRCIPLDKDVMCNIFTRYGYDVTVVTIVTESRVLQKGEEEDVGGTDHNYRNNRNNVTQIIPIDQVKTALISLLADKKKVPIQEFLDTYPDYETAIKQLLENMKRDGEIFEGPAGMLQLL